MFSRLSIPMIMSILSIVSYCVLLPNIAQIIDKTCIVFDKYELFWLIVNLSNN